MCRLLFVIGSQKNEQLKHFLNASKKHMSLGNRDGLGFTAIREGGEIFTQRWLNNDEAFKQYGLNQQQQEVVNRLGKFVNSDSKLDFTTQGEVNWSDVRTVMMHTRMATCKKGIDNVHPFVDNENKVSIVHNGVISNHVDFPKLNSTCDSEVILTQYKSLGVENDLRLTEELTNSLEGYWAIGTTGIDSNGNRFLDIHRNDSSATLYATYCKQLESIVICTRHTILTDTFKDLKWEHDGVFFEVNPFVVTRFNPVNGEVMQQHDWVRKPKTKVYKPNFSIVKPEKKKENKTVEEVHFEPSNFQIEYDKIYEDRLIDDGNTDGELELLQKLDSLEAYLTKEEIAERENLSIDDLEDFIYKVEHRLSLEA